MSVIQTANGTMDLVDKSGFLELRGFKNKLFVAVAGDKVFLYKNSEDYRLGIGITYIEMNVGNVKEVDRRGFDLTTPYRIFSFSADSDQEKEEWVEAMQQSIAAALSNSEVAERIWAAEPNRFCADCGSPKPDWASINLCVVICKRCGERKLDFLGWVHAIRRAAGSAGDTLSEQQLTEADVPLLVDRCIDYITQCDGARSI
nr:PREDICTED: arf-GAP with Rho-GAP domain, ANK repeat and PH domain-containing protein 1-like [Apteryx mantelli mantelli]